ncbi:MAG: hypothetical protein SFW67_25910 [Myxococcaceae bacterium]|nr:hypothetical protein [Myxococcaceae bacterium]
MTFKATTVPFEAELFAKLAREELARGAVWMAEMAAALAQKADATNQELCELLEATRRARRLATGEG